MSDDEPMRLCQAEAVDDLSTSRFLTFGALSAVEFQAPIDMVLRGVETGAVVGTCRAFWTKPQGVSFLVTLDYESPERLLLEADELGLRVSYAVREAGVRGGTIDVTSLWVSTVTLTRWPPPASVADANPHRVCLPLRPAKQWRWA